MFFVFVVFRFQFSPINKEISLSSRLLLVSRNSLSSKISKFGKHSLISLGGGGWEISIFSHFFTAYSRLMLEAMFVKNRSNRSSLIQIP